ncbi:MAG: hypothetical protein FWH15_05670 [Betaproteobacteria bacterium]|nr:hypothetical protein [Betaproteobacteria bacterium]
MTTFQTPAPSGHPLWLRRESKGGLAAEQPIVCAPSLNGVAAKPSVVCQIAVRSKNMQTPRRFLSRLALLTGLLVVFSLPAWAQTPYEHKRCDDAVVKIVGNHFQLDNFSYRVIVAGECKPWPTDKSRMIAAFAYDAGVEYEKQLLLVVVNISGKQVIASYKETIQEDATTEFDKYSLRLDTARYQLSETTRAFALRLFTSQSRCSYDGGWSDELTLYVIAGKELRPILSQDMHKWRRHVISGNPCGGHNDEDYEENYVEANIFIAVENTSTNGFADLRLSAESDARKKPPSVVVKYNGENYDLAPWDKAFNSWWEAVAPWNKP